MCVLCCSNVFTIACCACWVGNSIQALAASNWSCPINRDLGSSFGGCGVFMCVWAPHVALKPGLHWVLSHMGYISMLSSVAHTATPLAALPKCISLSVSSVCAGGISGALPEWLQLLLQSLCKMCNARIACMIASVCVVGAGHSGVYLCV